MKGTFPHNIRHRCASPCDTSPHRARQSDLSIERITHLSTTRLKLIGDEYHFHLFDQHVKHLEVTRGREKSAVTAILVLV